MDKKRIAFYIIWLLVVAIAPITVLKTTPYATISGNKILVINFWQRIVALTAFVLLSVQIIIGAYMEKWAGKLGNWIFKFHSREGFVVYSLIVLHTILFGFYKFRTLGILDPFYIFTDFCLLCKPKIELFYTFGRISFVFVTLSFWVYVFRASDSWMRNNWKKFHILNYFAFFFTAVHLFFVGTDAFSTPFIYFFWSALAAISLIVYKKALRYLQKVL